MSNHNFTRFIYIYIYICNLKDRKLNVKMSNHNFTRFIYIYIYIYL